MRSGPFPSSLPFSLPSPQRSEHSLKSRPVPEALLFLQIKNDSPKYRGSPLRSRRAPRSLPTQSLALIRMPVRSQHATPTPAPTQPKAPSPMPYKKNPHRRFTRPYPSPHNRHHKATAANHRPCQICRKPLEIITITNGANPSGVLSIHTFCCKAHAHQAGFSWAGLPSSSARRRA